MSKPRIKKTLLSKYWGNRTYKPTPEAKPQSPFTMVTDNILECQVTAVAFFRNYCVMPFFLVFSWGILYSFYKNGMIGEFPIIIAELYALLIILVLMIALIRFPAMPPIYFDRERQIVYTWRKNWVAATSFEQLHVNQNHFTVELHMLREDDKNPGQYTDACMASKASGYNFSGKFLNNDFLGTIVAFMEEGKGALITGDSYKGKVPIWDRFIFSIKKPDNFEERLDKLLAYQQSLFDEKENTSAKVD